MDPRPTVRRLDAANVRRWIALGLFPHPLSSRNPRTYDTWFGCIFLYIPAGACIGCKIGPKLSNRTSNEMHRNGSGIRYKNRSGTGG